MWSCCRSGRVVGILACCSDVASTFAGFEVREGSLDDGPWPSEDVVPEDERMRAIIGADHFTAPLRGALETCIKVGHQGAQLSKAAA